MSEEKDKGFRVIDKRRIGRDDAPEEKNEVPRIGEEKTGKESPHEEQRGKERSERTPQEKKVSDEYDRADKSDKSYDPNFTDLVKSFFMQALGAMGMLEVDGVSSGPPNMDVARQFIDLLSILEKKTEGNLTSEEDSLLRDSLSQLRMAYVQLSEEKPNKF